MKNMTEEQRATIERLDSFAPVTKNTEMDNLARKALLSLKQRKNQDIQAWASRLADDVIDAND